MNKPDLLLLHGALGAKSQFMPLMSALDDTFRIHTLDFEGHGRSRMKERVFRDDHFAENVLDYLDENALKSINIFGYSLGGHVGLYLAKTEPERIDKIFTLATKFVWTPEIAEHETSFLDPDKILKKVPQFAKVLEERHTASGWRNVLQKTSDMFLALGNRNLLPLEALEHIPHVVRIGVGDRDTMVSLEESIKVYRSLPKGELQVFPATPHPLEKVALSKLVYSLREFFK